ncbi:MAG TPA: WD40 repeat domain-containing protein [Bacteroidetes bacterium]|nr:WD40 repeat domain-containing protein [Bacteroidota bacterium]
MLKKSAQLTGHNASIYALSYAAGQKDFLSAAGDGWIVKWNLEEPDIGQVIAKVGTQVFSLFFLKNENIAIAGDMNGGLHWVNLNDPGKTKNIAHHEKGVFEIIKVGSHIFTAGGGGRLTRWSIGECRALETYHLANQSLRSVVFSEKRNELAVGASDNSIYFLDATTLELKSKIENAHQNSVFSLAYSPDGKHLLSGGRDAYLNIWEIENNCKKTASNPAHWFTINDIVFHPGGHLFATASRDKTIKIWDAKNFELIKVLEGARDGGHFNSVNKLLWHPHENTLISCSDDRTIVLWK